MRVQRKKVIFAFFGVTYGWGISGHDKQFDTAKSVGQIAEKLIPLHAEARVFCHKEGNAPA